VVCGRPWPRAEEGDDKMEGEASLRSQSLGLGFLEKPRKFPEMEKEKKKKRKKEKEKEMKMQILDCWGVMCKCPIRK